MIYFISDLHIGHKSVIKLSKRPFKDLDEMHNLIIQKWNNIVKPEDVVYHVGDFCLNSKYVDFYKRLNGSINFIRGNHDEHFHLPFVKRDIHKIKYKGKTFVLCHYPMEDWRGLFNGYIHIHGHTHQNMPFISGKNRFNVSADVLDYTPVSIETIIEKSINLRALDTSKFGGLKSLG